MEIRGNGYIGYAENGFVTEHFERPPEMLLDHGVKLGGPKAEGKPELSGAEWLADMEVTRPRTSAEYDRAISSAPSIRATTTIAQASAQHAMPGLYANWEASA